MKDSEQKCKKKNVDKHFFAKNVSVDKDGNDSSQRHFFRIESAAVKNLSIRRPQFFS